MCGTRYSEYSNMSQNVVPMRGLVRIGLSTAPAETYVDGYNPKSAPVELPGVDPFPGLAGYIRKQFEAAKSHRQSEGIDDRLLECLRALRGQYDPKTLADIKAFGGSEVYARIVASKVRGASAMLREIYTAADRPWMLSPTPVPHTPNGDIEAALDEVLRAEVLEAAQQGTPPTPEIIAKRRTQLREQLMEAQHKQAEDALRQREAALDDLLWEGNFYNALWDFLGDLPAFPYAVLQGPIVHMKGQMRWENGVPKAVTVPTLVWERCSPFDVYFAPWASTPQEGYIIRRSMIGPSTLRALRDLPSYSPGAIDRVLEMNPQAMGDWYEYVEAERAELEERESSQNGNWGGAADRPYPLLAFHGEIKGEMLVGWGMPEDQVPDPGAFLDVVVYLIGGEVIGVTKNPHPTGRKPFYVDSYERVPGSPYGHGINDLISDVAAVCNASLRALVNNLAISSGPMCWLNEDMLSENDQNSDKLYPWKIFRTRDSMMGTAGSQQRPMEFFQPDSNAQVLLTVFERFSMMADDLSSIPRIMQGSGHNTGGAARTASGLSMLMEASNRTIKQTVSSVDQNVIEQAVQDLNIYLALTRTDIVTDGDLSVKARGAVELVQRETLRMRRMEFLQVTANPMDAQLVGMKGRHSILREIARDLNLPVDDVVTTSPAQLEAAAAAAASMGNPGTPAAPGSPQPDAAGIARPQANNPGA